MKKYTGAIALLIIGAVVVGGFLWCAKHPTAVNAALSGKSAERKSFPISDAITIQPGYVQTLRYSFPADKTPGKFQGYWQVEGKSGHLKGATDDTLTGFSLLGPNNDALQKLTSPTSGNFSIRYEGGMYTFSFENSGFLRSSPRTVTFTGTYQPDKE